MEQWMIYAHTHTYKRIASASAVFGGRTMQRINVVPSFDWFGYQEHHSASK